MNTATHSSPTPRSPLLDDEVRRRMARFESGVGTPAEGCQAGDAGDDPPSDPGDPPPFRDHADRLRAAVRALAAEAVQLAQQIPPANSLNDFLTAQPVADDERQRREAELLYAMVAAQVTLEQATDWLRRLLRGGGGAAARP